MAKETSLTLMFLKPNEIYIAQKSLRILKRNYEENSHIQPPVVISKWSFYFEHLLFYITIYFFFLLHPIHSKYKSMIA